ncbi:MAG: putative rane protein, partial [Acidimicrobiales bacterium]|nr:putative rane protein [Acidimicrobiales bacterium]
PGPQPGGAPAAGWPGAAMTAGASVLEATCGLLVAAIACAVQRALALVRRAAVRGRLAPARSLRIEPPRWVDEMLTRVGGPALAGAWRPVAMASGLGVVGVALVAGPAVAMGVVAAGLVAGVVSATRQRGRAAARFEQQLPVLLEEVGRALRGGASLLGALAVAAERTPPPVGPEVAGVVREARRGVRVTEALERWAGDQRSPSLRLVVAALDLGARTGASHARAVDGVAATLRDRRAIDTEVRALATQARASAAVLVAAPVAFAVVASATDARTASFLCGTAPGLGCLAGGLALDAVGAWWMHRLTTRVV